MKYTHASGGILIPDAEPMDGAFQAELGSTTLPHGVMVRSGSAVHGGGGHSKVTGSWVNGWVNEIFQEWRQSGGCPGSPVIAVPVLPSGR